MGSRTKHQFLFLWASPRGRQGLESKSFRCESRVWACVRMCVCVFSRGSDLERWPRCGRSQLVCVRGKEMLKREECLEYWIASVVAAIFECVVVSVWAH